MATARLERVVFIRDTHGYRVAIHSNLEFAGTLLAAYAVSVRVSNLIGVRSLGDVRSFGDSATPLLNLPVN